jgi:hypothetical protein
MLFYENRDLDAVKVGRQLVHDADGDDVADLQVEAQL